MGILGDKLKAHINATGLQPVSQAKADRDTLLRRIAELQAKLDASAVAIKPVQVKKYFCISCDDPLKAQGYFCKGCQDYFDMCARIRLAHTHTRLTGCIAR